MDCTCTCLLIESSRNKRGKCCRVDYYKRIEKGYKKSRKVVKLYPFLKEKYSLGKYIPVCTVHTLLMLEGIRYIPVQPCNYT